MIADTRYRFRFLDLPKELRLTVYEYLPTKVTVHQIVTEFEDLPNRLKYTLVRITIPGVVILATCSYICSEAGAILRPRLDAINRQPIRISTDNEPQTHSVVCVDRIADTSHSMWRGEDVYTSGTSKGLKGSWPTMDTRVSPSTRFKSRPLETRKSCTLRLLSSGMESHLPFLQALESRLRTLAVGTFCIVRKSCPLLIVSLWDISQR
jgi:hypothetical protein